MVELLAAIVIIITLAALIVPFYRSVFGTITKAGCIANMRALHGSFAAYVQDNGYWPQLPYQQELSEDQYEDFWVNALHPYVSTDKVWLCPALLRMHVEDNGGRALKIHYVPTEFDANRISPTRWPTQPWLTEQASVHGGGPLILFPDGSIKSLNDLLIQK